MRSETKSRESLRVARQLRKMGMTHRAISGKVGYSESWVQSKTSDIKIKQKSIKKKATKKKRN